MITFFIGSYTEFLMPEFGGIGRGIYTVQLNNETGELINVYTEPSRNPSYLAISSNNKYLYCISELDVGDNPKVKAYKVNANFTLEFLNEQLVSGGYPCHLALHGTNILVACYATGNVLHYPLSESGELLACKVNHQHKGSSIHEVRQEGPHAHQVTIHPNIKDIYVCDLGIDALKAYHFQGNDFVSNEKRDYLLPKGVGPRHMVFNDNGSIAYILNELSGTVCVLQNQGDTFKVLNSYNAFPNEYEGEPSGSAIRLHPLGNFLYAANRKSETISIFRIIKDGLELVEHQYTNGKEIREFNITPNGKWLIACHQNSHDTVVYRIQENGTLIETFRTKEILSPVCIVFPN